MAITPHDPAPPYDPAKAGRRRASHARRHPAPTAGPLGRTSDRDIPGALREPINDASQAGTVSFGSVEVTVRQAVALARIGQHDGAFRPDRIETRFMRPQSAPSCPTRITSARAPSLRSEVSESEPGTRMFIGPSRRLGVGSGSVLERLAGTAARAAVASMCQRVVLGLAMPFPTTHPALSAPADRIIGDYSFWGYRRVLSARYE